jgi:hypothetical protein
MLNGLDVVCDYVLKYMGQKIILIVSVYVLKLYHLIMKRMFDNNHL